MTAIFTIDVEDWFHILDVASAPSISEWDTMPSRVERNFLKLLDILADRNATATCFFLGWVGRKFPHLVRRAAAAGHEIASHGYAHRLVHQMSQAEFLRDASLSKRVLEDICGEQVMGYRAPGFSLTAQTNWFFTKLTEAGYTYDSSVFSTFHGHGDVIESDGRPYTIETENGSLHEFPMSVVRFMGWRFYCFGGGYLRLTPMFLVKRMAARIRNEGRPVICYVHPREIDPEHPRLSMSLLRYFKSYSNLKSTERKVRRLSAELDFTSFRTLLANGAGLPAREASRAGR